MILSDEDKSLKNIQQFSVSYDLDLPEFQTKYGVHRHADGLTVTSPPQLWVRALDFLFERMKEAKVNFSLIRAISGAGQVK